MNKASLMGTALVGMALGCLACDTESARNSAELELAKNGVTIQLDHGLSSTQITDLTSDLIDLKTHKSFNFGSRNIPAYEWIFGSYSGADVERFISERVHYITPALSDEEMSARTDPKKFEVTDFLVDPVVAAKEKSSPGMWGAINTGGALYLSATVSEQPTRFFVHDQWVPVESPRVGILSLGPAYTDAFTGTPYEQELRESILVHEARHSDCAEPLTADDIQVGRASKNLTEFNRDFKARSCGEIHALCPTGHMYSGIAACDDVVWGAYAIEGIFTEQMSNRYRDYDRATWSALQVTVADVYSRLLYDVKKLKSGEFGKPNLDSR